MHRLSGEVVDAICQQSETTRRPYVPSLLPASASAEDGAVAESPHESTSSILSQLNAHMTYQYM